jgi:hypothetical protein
MSTDEIAGLVLRERQSRDRGRYDRMADCFAGDSAVEMSWFRGGGAAFVRATRDMAGGDHAVHQYQAEMAWLYKRRTPAATAANERKHQ